MYARYNVNSTQLIPLLASFENIDYFPIKEIFNVRKEILIFCYALVSDIISWILQLQYMLVILHAKNQRPRTMLSYV